MTIKMTLDDALALRKALEPLTHCMVDDGENAAETEYHIAITSIAISLKRIADALETANKRGKDVCRANPTW